MALMFDTEGEEIPQCDHKNLFDLSLHNDGMMLMQVPAFSTQTGVYTAQTGVLKVSIFDVFDEFLANKTYLINCPDDPLLIAAKLAEYAVKFEAMAAVVASTPPPTQPSDEELAEFLIAGTMVFKSCFKPTSH